ASPREFYPLVSWCLTLHEQPQQGQSSYTVFFISATSGKSMNTIKCVVVGDDYNSIKIKMLISYITNKFPSEYVPTVFDNYSANFIVGGVSVNLDLWNTSEDYSRLRTLSYLQTDVFVVTFSVVSLSSFENVKEKWVPEIRHFCGECVPMLLVGQEIELCTNLATLERLSNYQQRPITESSGHALAKEIGAV
ncbi:Rho GTPase, partial [Nowakowskiella sp. JEL0078]